MTRPATTRLRDNLYSDTQTRPCAAMRRAMANADVGDEQRREDPTVNRLQEQVAALLGKEAALFLPSGTMCNQIAFGVLGRPGDEVILDRLAHPIHFEGGGLAAISGLSVAPVDGDRGIFTPAQVKSALHSRVSEPRPAIVSIEQTSNLHGGTVWPLDRVRAIRDMATAQGLKLHMDGARLPNAVIASGVAASAFAAGFDSVWIDLSKGLGCPVGAVLAGSKAFIGEAWRLKNRLGGAMRQAGIIAAAGLYALEHNMERLAEDHANARRLATGLAGIPGLTVDGMPETNMVYFGIDPPGPPADRFGARLEQDFGVRMSVMGERRVRAVTHLDIDAAGVDRAIDAVSALLAA